MATWDISGGGTEFKATIDNDGNAHFPKNTSDNSIIYTIIYTNDDGCSETQQVTIPTGCKPCTVIVYSDAEGASVSWHNGSGTVYGTGTITDGSATITVENVDKIFVTLTQEGVEFDENNGKSIDCGGTIRIDKVESEIPALVFISHDSPCEITIGASSERIQLAAGQEYIYQGDLSGGNQLKVHRKRDRDSDSYSFKSRGTDDFVYLDAVGSCNWPGQSETSLWDMDEGKWFGADHTYTGFSHSAIYCGEIYVEPIDGQEKSVSFTDDTGDDSMNGYFQVGNKEISLEVKNLVAWPAETVPFPMRVGASKTEYKLKSGSMSYETTPNCKNDIINYNIIFYNDLP